MAEGFPSRQDSRTDPDVVRHALGLLKVDEQLDDGIFTPPAAFGMGTNLDGGDESGDRSPAAPKPQSPAGSEALAEPIS